MNLVRRELVSLSASDEEFQHKLEGQIYEENRGVARFVLCAIAADFMNRESRIDLWQVENRQFVWTIEHVFPQGSNISPDWVKMIADGDEKKAKDFQQSHVHKLGNLTLSGFNSTLGTKSFAEKRDRTDQLGHPVGYKNILKLNEDLATADKWGVEQIDKRTSKLVAQAMRLFRMDNSK